MHISVPMQHDKVGQVTGNKHFFLGLREAIRFSLCPLHISIMGSNRDWITGIFSVTSTVSAKFIGPSDRTDKSALGPICMFSSLTGSDVGSGTMHTPRMDGVL